LRLEDFDYELPPELIAQTPADRRDASRLLVVPAAGPPRHRAFRDLPELLPEGALLVVNDARVVPARLHARKPTGGRVEVFLVEKEADGAVWRCLIRGQKALAAGTPLELLPPRGQAPAGPAPSATYLGDGRVALGPGDLDEWGEIPLPPYIERAAGPTAADRERYQTVFARAPGAVAAPTAGLHFTDEILARLAARAIERVAVTLHVVHVERYDVPAVTAAAHAAARAAGRPVVAVGTTVVRTLESALTPDGRLSPGPGSTRLFIRPGHVVRSVDQLVTNFHMPRSTLLMLVCAFAGRERILTAYREAVARRYRFFSYGDAMLLEKP
jgi:S-adenosylmethionine:tRNA ribosyltransferase-isomerase